MSMRLKKAFDGNLCRCTGYRPILDAVAELQQEMWQVHREWRIWVLYGQRRLLQWRIKWPFEWFVGRQEVRATIVHPLQQRYRANISTRVKRKHQFKPLALGNKRKKWYRPTTLQELLEIKHAHPQAKLIGGSTETQIEIKFKAMDYSTSVYVNDIAELRQYSFHDDYLEIGGNVALTDLENICDEAVKYYGEVKSQPFRSIKKAIHYFAGRQIRNVGTPAGNLATASPISDLNPVFVATKSTLVAKSLKKTLDLPMESFFRGYRKTALPEDAVIAAMRIPVAAEKGRVHSHVQAVEAER